MKVACVLFLMVGYALSVQSHSRAHSADEVMNAIGQRPIPKELLEATLDLEVTAGQTSSWENAHARQHALLEHFLRAENKRKCTEAMADIFKFDAAIVEFRNEGNAEKENALRQVRDDTAAFLKAECQDMSVNKPQTP